MQLDKNQQAFFALVKAGLWEQDVRLANYGKIDFNAIYRLAEEQSVVGLVAAGIEKVVDIKVPKGIVLQFVSMTLQLEQRNSVLNGFVGTLMKKLSDKRIVSILMKGQGIAKCYERPLWRAAGDIDLLVRSDEYDEAKVALLSIYPVENIDENLNTKEYCATIGEITVEIHGSLYCDISRRLDKQLNSIQKKCFEKEICAIHINDSPIRIPPINENVMVIFTHFVKHFLREGLGIRQLCDWCRLMWKYQNDIDVVLLNKRIESMRLMSEWKAFASFAVEYLGMPVESMPLYSTQKKWSRKANRIMQILLDVGNFGHKRNTDYQRSLPVIMRKIVSFFRFTSYCLRCFPIFPYGSMRAWCSMVRSGLSTVKA